MSNNNNDNNNTTTIRGSDPNFVSDHRRRRLELEAEERARQQVAVRFRNERGSEWYETQSAAAFWKHAQREKGGKLKAYSAKQGQEDQRYDVIGLAQAPPKKKKKNDNDENN